MISVDVLSLARAAPEPASSSRTSSRDDGNSFNQFLEAAVVERPVAREDPVKSWSEEHQTSNDDHKYAESEPIESKRVEEKPKAKSETQEPAELDESVKETIAALVAGQVLNAVAPVIQPEEAVVKSTGSEGNIPVAVVAVQPNSQATVIQLPDTEPQPLPDELKQTIEQPKVEVKDFQTLIDAAAKNLENQAIQETDVTAVAKPVVEVPGTKDLGEKEQAVKVVELNTQPEDLAAMEASRTTGGLYAMAAVKSENLIQPKTLPMIREISQEVVNLVREQGQSMRIQVHPENMGKIDLRLISNSDGIRVVMTAENPATAKLLENNMNQLNQSMKDAGLALNGTSVNSQGAQGQSNNPSFNQSQQGSLKSTRPIFLDEPISISPVAITTSSTGLDYRV
jgi:flagellar hook-length control protein FliK